MTPSQRHQIQPAGVIAEFGKRNNPLFLVEKGSIPGEEEIDEREPFLVRDSDQALPERLIATGELDIVDSDAGVGELEFNVDQESGAPTYKLSAGDIVGAIGAVARDREMTEVRMTDTNLPAYMLDKIVGPAELASNNPDSEPYRFEIAA